MPEEVIVLETVGTVEGFVAAVRRIEGLEWLGEVAEEDIPPDDDFFLADHEGRPTERTLRGRMFLVFTNQQALQQMLSLWRSWREGHRLPQGLGGWSRLFSQLRDVRLWGIRDRLIETGVLDDWRLRDSRNEQFVPCEIELWFRTKVQQRQVARNRLVGLLAAASGQVLHEATIPEIAYHAVLARLPIQAVRPLIDEVVGDITFANCEGVQFFRATGQTAGTVPGDLRTADPAPAPPPSASLGQPVVALFDGLPLQNHRRLADRLVVDDPDDLESQYPATERRHGTAMASLILHGDIDAGEAPLNRRLYVRPILCPDMRPGLPFPEETAPQDKLLVDLVHRAVRRLFSGEGGQPPVSPEVRAINLSVGIRDRLFEGEMSPLARLLDWLSWQYKVLFIVSAGNHLHDIALRAPREAIRGLSPQELQTCVLQAVAGDARRRRLLSPAEAVNALTVGAVHQDSSTGAAVTGAIQPFGTPGLPSIINAQGMGYRRAIKPEILLPGGRVVLLDRRGESPNSLLEVYTYCQPPGQRVAAPGRTPGDLSYTWHTRGTSNATALASRVASQLHDVLDELRAEQGGDLIDTIPRAIWLKALLVHGASWGNAGAVLRQALVTAQNSRQFKEYLSRLLGYGVVEPSRLGECTAFRVTALGCGQLQADQAHMHRVPLPPSLSGQQGRRRLTITLAWLTPVRASQQAWRRAVLWFTPPKEPLGVERQEADWQAVKRGTVQHEVLEDDRATVFVDGANAEVLVNCRADTGTLDETIPYALVVTLEVGAEIGIDIYNEVRVRVHAPQIAIAPGG